MKKILISLLIILTMVSGMFVFATENITPNTVLDDTLETNQETPTATTATVPTVTVTPSPTPSPTPVPTPIETPSVTAPFTFSATTADGKTDMIQGEVDGLKLVFKVKPNGKEDFTLVKIVNKDTGVSYNINKDISKGASPWSGEYDAFFNTTDVDKTVTFELLWKDFTGSDRITTTIFKINVARPMLTVTVTPVDAIVPGAPIVIKYHVQNTGNVTLKKVLLQDPTAAFLNNQLLFSAEEFLAPGQMFEREATISLDGEATLAPSVTFWYKDDSYTVKGNELLLSAQEVIPTITLTCDSYVASQKGGMHRFKYTITNTTQIPLTDIYVYDSDASDAGIVTGPLNLAVGETYNGTYEIPVYKSGYYKFKIHYSYAGAEEEKQQFAKTDLPIRLPNEVFIDVIRTNPETITAPGKITFTLLIENGTADDLRNVAIEEESGLFKRIELNRSIPAATSSGSTQFQYDVTVDVQPETKVVQFNLHYTINGELSIINTSYSINFIGALETAPPSSEVQTPIISTPTIPVGKDKDNGIGWWIWILLFLLIFFIVLVIILIFIKSRTSAQTANISVKRKIANDFDDFNYEDYEDLDDSELDALLDEAELSETAATAAVIEEVADVTEDAEEPEGKVNDVTAAILKTDNIVQNEEFSTDFNDEVDDEGVKIFKSKK